MYLHNCYDVWLLLGYIQTFLRWNRNQNGIYITFRHITECAILLFPHYIGIYETREQNRARTLVLPLQKLFVHNVLHHLKHIFNFNMNSSNITVHAPSMPQIILEITVFKVRKSTTYCIKNKCYQVYTTK